MIGNQGDNFLSLSDFPPPPKYRKPKEIIQFARVAHCLGSFVIMATSSISNHAMLLEIILSNLRDVESFVNIEDIVFVYAQSASCQEMEHLLENVEKVRELLLAIRRQILREQSQQQ